MTSTQRTTAEAGSTTSIKPIIAIVGRPNVGKSTLFNRLMGSRTAIVMDEPGTTRDRVYGDVDWDGTLLTIVDTGGLDPHSSGDLAQEVQQQARLALEEADAILFLVDAQTAVTPLDEEVADLMRRQRRPLLLVANKVEGRTQEANVAEFHTLGLGDPITISAYHGSGIADLMERLLDLLPPQPILPATEPGTQVAIIGRPNVGKSLLVNAILGQERVLVSPIPGTTRDAIDTPFRYQGAAFTLIDTAGIRRSGRVDRGVERFSVLRALRAVARCDVAVLVLDASEGITSQDTHIAGYAKESYKGLVVAVNKWDLAKELEAERQTFASLVSSRLLFFPHAPVVFASAKLRQGIPELLNAIMKVQLARDTRVPTPAVNQCIRQALQSHQPASVHGRQLKVFYVTQPEVSPPTFVFFVNDPALLHFSYQRYLENRLREAFGFEGAALRLIFKSREAASTWSTER